MSERRKFKRWALKSELAAVDTESGSTIGYLSDVSLGGMMLVSKDLLQTNIVMPLTVKLADDSGESEPLKVVTKIVRCREDENKNSFKTGLKLIDVSTHDLKMIEQLISDHGAEEDENC